MRKKTNNIIVYEMNNIFIFFVCILSCVPFIYSMDSLRDFAQKNIDQMKRITTNQSTTTTVLAIKKDGTIVISNQFKNNQSVQGKTEVANVQNETT